MKITLYGQVGEGSIHPVAVVESEHHDEIRQDIARSLRYMADTAVDPNGTFLETILRYDEDD